MSLEDWVLVRQLAYQGKKGCSDARCTRMFKDGDADWTECIGWHCSYCDEPCSSQGHRCDAAVAAERDQDLSGESS